MIRNFVLSFKRTVSSNVCFILVIDFESVIDFTYVRNVTTADGQVIAHKAIEQLYILGLAKTLLHGMPIFIIKRYLLFVIQTHQHIIANKIRLRKIHTSRVEAFEYQLGVVFLL